MSLALKLTGFPKLLAALAEELRSVLHRAVSSPNHEANRNYFTAVRPVGCG